MPAKRRKPAVRKKPAKAKPRPKKKKRLSKAELAALKRFKKRSRAAKKGHATRKLKQKIRERTYHVRDIEKDLGVLEELRKPIAILKKGERPTYTELEEHLVKVDERMLQWVDLMGPEWIKDDGTIAKERSGLRVLPIEMRNKLRRRLDRAEERDTLSQTAYEIAAEYDLPIKEVYTLWFS